VNIALGIKAPFSQFAMEPTKLVFFVVSGMLKAHTYLVSVVIANATDNVYLVLLKFHELLLGVSGQVDDTCATGVRVISAV
jgi:hypothetical protein